MRTPVDLLRQGAQRNAGSRRHAEIGDDDGVVEIGIGQLVHRIADVLRRACPWTRVSESNGHVAGRCAGAVKMGGVKVRP